MKHFGLIGKFVAQQGKQDELLAILLEAAEALKANEGCLHYIVSTGDEPGAIWVTEVWTDKAAHDASLQPDHIRALIAKAIPLIAGRSDRTELTVEGGKGL